MNTMLFPEDVANVIQSFYLCNKGDEATTDLLLAVGAELLDISPDKMLEIITGDSDGQTQTQKTSGDAILVVARSRRVLVL